MQSNKNYIAIGEAAKLLNVSVDTLRRWDKSGKLVAGRTEGNLRIYKVVDIATLMGGK